MFTPHRWSAPADEDVTIAPTNEGAVTHEFVILQHGVTISSEADLPETHDGSRTIDAEAPGMLPRLSGCGGWCG
jgi:hypothetical protein